MLRGRKFVCYEPPYNGRKFTRKQLRIEYKKTANQHEYPTFSCWFYDNLRVGNLVEITKNMH